MRTTPAASASVGLDGTPAHGYAGAPGNAYDTSMLRLAFTVPAGSVNCLSVDFRFLSEDFSSDFFNDGFLALLDSTAFTVDPQGDITAAYELRVRRERRPSPARAPT